MTLSISRRVFFTTIAATAVAVSLPAQAQQASHYLGEGLALSGYDPVAYFTDRKATQGSADFAADWDGVTWHFASAANRDAFLGNPTAYAPQYGGYCAYAVSQGYTASADPHAWSIHKDKLYVNFNRSVQGLWSLRKNHHVKQGDANWPSVLG